MNKNESAWKKESERKQAERESIQTTAVVRVPGYLAVKFADEARRRRVVVARVLFERLDPEKAKAHPDIPRGR